MERTEKKATKLNDYFDSINTSINDPYVWIGQILFHYPSQEQLILSIDWA